MDAEELIAEIARILADKDARIKKMRAGPSTGSVRPMEERAAHLVGSAVELAGYQMIAELVRPTDAYQQLVGPGDASVDQPAQAPAGDVSVAEARDEIMQIFKQAGILVTIVGYVVEAVGRFKQLNIRTGVYETVDRKRIYAELGAKLLRVLGQDSR